MKLTSLTINNYRTIDSLQIDFPSSYAALCGPNDCGKTDVIRAIRAVAKEEDPYVYETIDQSKSAN